MKSLDDVLTEKELREPVGSIRKALHSQEHRDQLRRSMTDVVEGAVDDVYKRVSNAENIDRQELTDIGWEAFVPTIGRYIEQSRILLNEGKTPYKFATKLNFHVGKRVVIYIKRKYGDVID